MKEFIIDHIDPFGQGVYKEDEKIFFIPKTLPNETGTFNIISKKKGVHFGKLRELRTKSPFRSLAECPHYNECNGCHFLHTDYDNELKFKKLTYQKLLNSLNHENLPEIEILSGPSRLHYRNRVQLHYDLKQKKIGFIIDKKGNLLSVPNCLIMLPEVRREFKKLMTHWEELVLEAGHPQKGHVEIYLYQNQVYTNWNKSYSEQGFTQVNEWGNQILKKKIAENIDITSENPSVLDLFGGDGNLLTLLPKGKHTSVDLYSDKRQRTDFFHLNLYAENALEEFLKVFPNKNFNTLIVDPPRNGFKGLDKWLSHYNPDQFCYVSCHPATMIRDIKSISTQHKISQIFLIDLFPGTFHFEAMIFFENA